MVLYMEGVERHKEPKDQQCKDWPSLSSDEEHDSRICQPVEL